jgi:hypothetical protein
MPHPINRAGNVYPIEPHARLPVGRNPYRLARPSREPARCCAGCRAGTRGRSGNCVSTALHLGRMRYLGELSDRQAWPGFRFRRAARRVCLVSMVARCLGRAYAQCVWVVFRPSLIQYTGPSIRVALKKLVDGAAWVPSGEPREEGEQVIRRPEWSWASESFAVL